MISIIISSVDSDQLDRVSSNINQTIGVPFEIVSFDNRNGEIGICEIYNQGIERAKFETLCFMHEDVEIHTKGWGKTILDYFKNNENLGLVGVAGKKGKSAIAGSWNTHSETTYINLIQNFKYTDRSPERLLKPEKLSEKLNEVTWVDGVWFCSPKKVAKEFPFDTKLRRFHGYDIDFSMGIGQKYKVAVSHEVLMTHFSEGHFSSDWLKAMIYIHEKWRHKLPIHPDPTDKSLSWLEKHNFRKVIKRYKEDYQIPFRTGLKIFKLSNFRNYGLAFYLKMYVSLLRIFFLSK